MKKKYYKRTKEQDFLYKLLENKYITIILSVIFAIISAYLIANSNPIGYTTVILTVAMIILSQKDIIAKKIKKNRYSTLTKKEIDKLDGFSFEDYLSVQFEKLGYKVSQTAKAGDFGADLIIEKDGERTAIQAKRYKGKVGNEAIYQVSGGMRYYDCTKGIVVTNSYFTPSAKELAKKCNIELWNGHILKQKFNTR